MIQTEAHIYDTSRVTIHPKWPINVSDFGPNPFQFDTILSADMHAPYIFSKHLILHWREQQEFSYYNDMYFTYFYVDIYYHIFNQLALKGCKIW